MVSIPAKHPVLSAAATGLRCVLLAAVTLSGHAVMAAPASAAADAEPDGAMMLALADVPGTTGAERAGPQLEISTTSLPRFDSADSAIRTSRIDMTTWAGENRSQWGVSLGMSNNDASTAPFMQPNRAAFAPAMDLGVKWRYAVDGRVRLDVTAYKRLAPPDALTLIQTRGEGQYGARVEMALGSSAPKTGFVAERGFLGVQLESGARLTLRRSGGKPMMYYRSKF